MYKHASTVRALNDGGIYIRNREDMIRVEYGLFKGLQKLASKLPEEMNPKDAETLEKAKDKAKANEKKFTEKKRKEFEAYSKKTLGRFINYGVKIEYNGALHEGDITFTITNNFLNRRGEKLDPKGFEAFVAEASKQKKDYAKYLKQAKKEVDRLSNLSSLAYEGKGRIPKRVPPATEKIIRIIAALFGIKYVAFMAALVVHIMIPAAATLQLTVFIFSLGGLIGLGFLTLFAAKVAMYGIKDAVNYFKLKSRDVSEKVKNLSKVASARPSVDYQVGIMVAYSHH